MTARFYTILFALVVCALLSFLFVAETLTGRTLTDRIDTLPLPALSISPRPPTAERPCNSAGAAQVGQSPITTEEEYDFCSNLLRMYERPNYTGFPFPNFRSLNHKPFQFTSQFRQDWFVFSAMFRHMYLSGRSGVYIDLATSQYRALSNTFFLDKCLSWPGICIEPQRALWDNIIKHRSCQLVPECVYNETREVLFESVYDKNTTVDDGENDVLYGNGFAGIAGINKLTQVGSVVALNCTTLQALISASASEVPLAEREGRLVVDFMSLDIEGAELVALQGIDFSRTLIEVIVVEVNDHGATSEYLERVGYRAMAYLHCDIVYVHTLATEKMLWIESWIENHRAELNSIWRVQLDEPPPGCL